MKLDVALSNHTHSANAHFLNALEEAWHDEPFSADVVATCAVDIDAKAEGGPGVRANPEGLTQLESRPSRSVEVEIPLIVPVAA